jgi:Holliday junction resolvase RusA-like endonuclease
VKTLDELLVWVDELNLADGVIDMTVPMLAPSQNHYVKHAVIRGQLRSYKTSEARSFYATVAAYAAGRTISPESDKERKKVAYRVTVTAILGPKDRRDADNSLKCCLDAIKDCGLIHSDARVKQVIGNVEWNMRKYGPATRIRAEVIK